MVVVEVICRESVEVVGLRGIIGIFLDATNSHMYLKSNLVIS